MTDQAPELLPSDMIGDYKALPESFRKHIINLEIFIGDCDNEAELDTDGATKALNGIIVELLCGLALTRPPSERPVAQVAWRDIAETLCAVDGNGFLHEASPTQQAAYEVRAKAVAALTAERPEAGRENLTAEEFAQVLPRKDAP